MARRSSAKHDEGDAWLVGFLIVGGGLFLHALGNGAAGADQLGPIYLSPGDPLYNTLTPAEKALVVWQ